MTVNIKGTFSVKQREHNGLEAVADVVNRDRLIRIPVVGYVTWHAHRETAADDVVTVNIEAIEPACAPDGTDTPESAQVWNLLDKLRKRAGKGNVAETLFGQAASELAGQLSIDDDGPEAVRDGREVPPPSAEEIMAERAEMSGDKSDSQTAAARKARKATDPPFDTP